MTQDVLTKGMGASPGIIKGRVCIVLSEAEISKIRKGDILVTIMTNPLFLPAMVKANGIITDVGGILCHAAIVAREFALPCIVGTENATKILKDNTIIKMDGKTGYVYLSK